MKQLRFFQRLVAVIVFSSLLAACTNSLPQDTSTPPPGDSVQTSKPASSPTAKNTSFPSITPSPRPTKTLTPVPEWVTDFAQPILDAIAGRTPEYQEDFSQFSSDWQYELQNCINNGCVISNGVLALDAAPGNGRDNYTGVQIPCCLNFTTFALMVEIDISQLTDENEAMFGYNNEGHLFDFEVKPSGKWWMHGVKTLPGVSSLGILRYPVPKILTLVILARNDQLAVYINDVPITAGEFTPVKNDRGLNLCAWSDGMTTAVVKYDNLKIWDLENIPGLP